MKSEDYIAQDALADSRALSRPLSKRHTVAIMATVTIALGLSLVIPTRYSSTGDELAESDSLFSNEHEADFDPSMSLTDAFGAGSQNVVVMQNGKNLDNYDDSIPESELADSDQEMDENVRKLAESQDKIVESKWFVEDVQKGDTISSLFEDLNIPPSVTMAILDNKKVAKEVNSLKLGEQISFLIDDNNVLQAFVKPLNSKQQLRFFKVSGSANRYDYVIEPISSPIKNGDVVENVEVAQASANEQKQNNVTAKNENRAAEAKSENTAKPDQKTTAAVPAKPETKLSPVETRGRLVVVTIKKGESFSGAVNRAGVTYSEINQILKMFKGRVQFSKNIHQGDTIRVLFSSAKGKGKITAVELTLGGKKYASYLNTADGKYYDENGLNSTKGAFRRFPINGKIVITSPFNPGRRHPVLGYVRPHNGTDFGVPVGTPIVAPADGVVDKAGYSRGSGYYVVIRHRGGISTVYMHLSKILVKPGQNVTIGKTIARSGNTGLSTGPHLHYEIRINGRPVNAMRVNLGKAADAQVDNTQRKKFVASVQQYKKDLYSSKLMAKN
ncbi:MAG: peptidoglycan DD-metalloendopeptidase family protein [Succinivibrio sp.]|nr:peptidoglycan DD-metalloendopeptidase family protein [Succinivibrio sp.]